MAAHSCVARVLAQRRPPTAGPRIHAPTKATAKRSRALALPQIQATFRFRFFKKLDSNKFPKLPNLPAPKSGREAQRPSRDEG
ncbi:hypothetical protein D3C87_1068640 [compost metagenome]